MTFPLALHAIGLGEMTVKSSLDQPFLAEIELLDVGSSPIVGIKVGVADPENFHQIGLERIAALSLLNFKIAKNAKGKFVIKVHSVERMTEPYMELVVDLIWPNGQLYKAYTVLLDPPGYQLVSTRAQSSPTYYKKASGYKAEPGVIDKTVITEVQHNPVSRQDSRKGTSYGPTVANENVWQIAQRYKTSEIILPQVVLAIVGANQEAFKEGNLNGLKTGVRLVIPATQEIARVPADLATEEVMAHDKAWNEKTPINHVLSPPYMNGQSTPAPQIHTEPAIKSSEVPVIPKFSMQAITPNQNTMMPQLITSTNGANSANNNQAPTVQNQPTDHPDSNSHIKAEISITTAAIESVRESNAVLMEQLHLLQDQNKKLQIQLDKRDKEMQLLQKQMKVMMKQRPAVAAQANSPLIADQSSNLLPLILLLLLLAGGGGYAYWYFKLREKDILEEGDSTDKSPLAKPQQPPVPVKAAEFSIVPTSSESQSPEIPQVPSAANIIISTESPAEKIIEQEPPKSQGADPVDSLQNLSKPIKKHAPSKKKEVLSMEEEIRPELSLEKEAEILPKNVEKSETNTELTKNTVADQDPLEFEPVTTQVSDTLADIPPSTETHENVNNEAEELAHADKNDNTKEADQELLEFESGLHQIVAEQPKQEVTKTRDQQKSDDDKSIDFVSVLSAGEQKTPEKSPESIKPEPEEEVEKEQNSIDIDPAIAEFFVVSEEKPPTEYRNPLAGLSSLAEPVSENDESKTANPLKSKAALDTLLALAKTYLGMDDIESARTSLEEVLEYGNDTQKANAQVLLDQIKNK